MGGGGAMRTVAKLAAARIRGVPSVQRASSQTAAAAWDDWEVADGGEEDGEGAARVVLGDVPSIQEAKAATAELKHAIHKYTLSFYIMIRVL